MRRAEAALPQAGGAQKGQIGSSQRGRAQIKDAQKGGTQIGAKKGVSNRRGSDRSSGKPLKKRS